MSRNIIGIDYGINSPALCKWNYENLYDDYFSVRYCQYFTTCIDFKYDKTKHAFFDWVDVSKDLPRTPSREQTTHLAKYVCLAYHFSRYIKEDTLCVALEDYAMGAAGRVFDIAENTGILKAEIYKSFIRLDVFSPKTVKKFAGKGNFSKIQMYDALCEKLDMDFAAYLGLTGCIKKISKGINKGNLKLESPLSDFTDATWITLYLREKLLNEGVV